MLRKVLHGRLTFTPHSDRRGRRYTFAGHAALGPLIGEIRAGLGTGGGCDPGGIRTRDLDLERVASWARLDDGVTSSSGDNAAGFYHGLSADPDAPRRRGLDDVPTLSRRRAYPRGLDGPESER